MAQHTIIVESASQPAAKQKRRKAPLILAGIGLVALVPVVGSTFAASISLNGGGNLEFGQGSQLTSTCDTSVTVTPDAVYNSVTDTWALTVDVTGIDASACEGKTFTVSTWNADTDTVADTWAFTLTGEDGDATTGTGTYLLAGSDYTADLTGSSLDAADLKAITIESSN